MYTEVSKMLFLGHLKGKLSSLHCLTVSLMMYFIDKVSVHSFADDNSLSVFESNIKNLKLILDSENKTAISWFQSNEIL